MNQNFIKKKDAGYFNNRTHGAINWSIGKSIECLEKPKISFAFFCYNIIKQRGEDYVRASFDTIKGQSNDIMVIDYGSKDHIEDLAKEYGFRYFDTPKTKGVKFHMSKCNNNAVHNAKHDIFVRLTQDIIFPQNFSWYISSFFSVNDPKKVYLFFKFFNTKENGKVLGRPGWIMTFYRPYLLEARGWDERTSYYHSEDAYGRWIMKLLYGCNEFCPPYYFLNHRHHPAYNNNKQSPEHLKNVLGGFGPKKQIMMIKRNKNYRKKVVNSYW